MGYTSWEHDQGLQSPAELERLGNTPDLTWQRMHNEAYSLSPSTAVRTSQCDRNAERHLPAFADEDIYESGRQSKMPIEAKTTKEHWARDRGLEAAE